MLSLAFEIVEQVLRDTWTIIDRGRIDPTERSYQEIIQGPLVASSNAPVVSESCNTSAVDKLYLKLRASICLNA